jgi:peroxiredoxin (alkyl hydroperoxide reductase subunit C)
VPVIGPGTPAPAFSVKTEDGADFTHEDLKGDTTVLVFFPNAFSGVCTDQFQIYEEVLDDIQAAGGRILGVSVDATYSQTAFRESMGVTIPMLSDFEPKGEMSRAFGVYWEPTGVATRALVVTDAEAVVRWSWEGEHPGVLPGANLIFDGLDAVSS